MSNRSKSKGEGANAEPPFVQSCLMKWSKGLQRGARWDKVSENLFFSTQALTDLALPAAAPELANSCCFYLLWFPIILSLPHGGFCFGGTCLLGWAVGRNARNLSGLPRCCLDGPAISHAVLTPPPRPGTWPAVAAGGGRFG